MPCLIHFVQPSTHTHSCSKPPYSKTSGTQIRHPYPSTIETTKTSKRTRFGTRKTAQGTSSSWPDHQRRLRGWANCKRWAPGQLGAHVTSDQSMSMGQPAQTPMRASWVQKPQSNILTGHDDAECQEVGDLGRPVVPLGAGGDPSKMGDGLRPGLLGLAHRRGCHLDVVTECNEVGKVPSFREGRGVLRGASRVNAVRATGRVVSSRSASMSDQIGG